MIIDKKVTFIILKCILKQDVQIKKKLNLFIFNYDH
jgi:hypothetical protein